MSSQIAILLTGFSIFSALLLSLASLTTHAVPGQGSISRMSGLILLLCLAALQGMHGVYLSGQPERLESAAYVVLLFLVAPAFYLFLRGALQLPLAVRARHLLFYAPALFAGWLDRDWAIPLAFVMGAGFALHLGVLVLRLRAQRERFRLEMFALGLHATLAMMILVLGVSSPLYGIRGFVIGYSIAIGFGFLLSVHVLLRFPDIVGKTADAVTSAYAVSTLTRVDREQATARLNALMDTERVYTDESLNLASLAGMLDLSPHQLSELVNTQFGVGFSRFVRERRVAAACRELIAEPQASVLSIGLSVGFTSQSNFYAAFREITGEVPGQYRKRQAVKG